MAASVECITSKNELNRKPQKKYYRQRAHTNPLADHSFDYPVKPSDWKKCCNSMYNLPENQTSKKVTFADIGCGYGGLLVSLSKMFPDNLALGMEIRVKVSDYVIDVSMQYFLLNWMLISPLYTPVQLSFHNGLAIFTNFIRFYRESKPFDRKILDSTKILHAFVPMR